MGLFTWSEGPRSSGVGFFCFHALGDTKQKKPTPLDRGPPLHVNRVYLFRGRVKIGPVVRRNPYLPRKTIRERGLRLDGTCKIFLENIC